MVDVLFEDIFTVTALDPDGKKFDKVSRIEARSEQFDMYMQLDVNTEIYPLHAGEKFTMVLAPTLSLDGTPDSGYFTQGGRKSLADKFEYVMHGKLYKISEEGSGANVKVEIYASYGGLLMLLKGDPSNAANFDLDQSCGTHTLWEGPGDYTSGLSIIAEETGKHGESTLDVCHYPSFIESFIGFMR